jgi:hypothetical protein
LIHTGYIGSGGENYEWYEHCSPPDPNPALPAAVKNAQQANWQACNEAAIKYNAAIPASDPTPDWVTRTAAEKGVADLQELEANTKMSYNPTMTLLEQVLAEQAAADSETQTQQAGVQLNQTLVIGAVVVGIAGLLFVTRKPKK